jgi:hypothetical protein
MYTRHIIVDMERSERLQKPKSMCVFVGGNEQDNSKLCLLKLNEISWHKVETLKFKRKHIKEIKR